jgi:flavodoxin
LRSVVIYASRKGNTRQAAEAMGRALASFGPVAVVAARDASATVWRGCDLLLVGGPTENRHATPEVMAFFERLPARALRGVDAAAFDTRLAWPRRLSGSAADQIRRRLGAAGAHLLDEPESFLVDRAPLLRQGELERAAGWARELARTCQAAPAPLALHHPSAA